MTKHHRKVPQELDGYRFDHALSQSFVQFSRARLARWADQGAATLNGEPAGQRQKVHTGDMLEVTEQIETLTKAAAEAMSLTIAYEDPWCLVIDKPAGLVVHPGASNGTGTLMNGLLHFDPALAGIPRAGIIHRLDKDTSGLLVVSRTPTAHLMLVAALQQRLLHREYLAVVEGRPPERGSITAPIGPARSDPRHQAVDELHGKYAKTDFTVAGGGNGRSLVRCVLHSGRTHQIRVHLAHIGHPLVGDPMYGNGPVACLRGQALHATQLTFPHPNGKGPVTVLSPPPPMFEQLLTPGANEEHRCARSSTRLPGQPQQQWLP